MRGTSFQSLYFYFFVDSARFFALQHIIDPQQLQKQKKWGELKYIKNENGLEKGEAEENLKGLKS